MQQFSGFNTHKFHTYSYIKNAESALFSMSSFDLASLFKLMPPEFLPLGRCEGNGHKLPAWHNFKLDIFFPLLLLNKQHLNPIYICFKRPKQKDYSKSNLLQGFVRGKRCDHKLGFNHFDFKTSFIPVFPFITI